MALPTDHPFKSAAPVIGTKVYAKWDTDTDADGHFTYSNGNLTLLRNALNSGAWRSVRSNIGVMTGKWYWEYTYDVGGGAKPFNDSVHGICRAGFQSANSYIGSDAHGYSWQDSNIGPLKYNNSGSSAYGTTGTAAGDEMMVALDLDNGKLWFGRNGTWFGSGDPAAGTNAGFTGLTGPFWAGAGLFTSTHQITANFGATAFSWTVPTGFNSGLYILP